MNRPLYQLVLWIVIFAIALGAYAYWYSMLTAATTAVAQLVEEVNSRTQDEASSAHAANELAQLAPAARDIQNYSVLPDTIVTFLEDQQSLGRSLGAAISVVSVTANPNPRPHLDLALAISGSFAAVMRTVGAIEYSPYDITVHSLNLSTTNTTATPGWTAAMTLSVGTASSSATTTP
jgi:hypothetical protein